MTGLPDNVQTARKEIEAHIAIRTGDVIDSGSSGNGSSQADDLDTRDYLNNSPQQFGSFVEQLYGGGSTSNQNTASAVAAKLNNIQNLNGLQLLTQSSQTNGSGAFSNMFAGTSSLSNGGQSNGLSSLYSKANGNSLENSFSPFALNALTTGASNNKSPDIVDNHSSMFSNFGVDALARTTNLLQHSTSQNGASATLNSLSSGNSSSASSNGNLNTSNNILNNLCNGSGLSMLNLQNAKNLLNVNSKFADIYSQLLANSNGNGNLTNSTTGSVSAAANQLLQQQHSINNTAAAVVNQLNLSNGLAQLNVNNSTNSNHSVNGTSVNGQQTNTNNLNSSNNSQLANGNNSFNVNSLYDRDEGLGDSPTFDSIAAANLATLTNSLAAQIANVNTSTSSTSSNSSGLGSNGLITNGNSPSSASSVNSTSSTNGVSLWPDFSAGGSPTSVNTNSNNSTTNNGSPTSTGQCNLINSSSSSTSSNSPNAFETSQNSPGSALSASITTAQQVSRA